VRTIARIPIFVSLIVFMLLALSTAPATDKKSQEKNSKDASQLESKSKKSVKSASKKESPKKVTAAKTRNVYLKGDPDSFAKKSFETSIGDRYEGESNPSAAAEEAYALRAYPASEIPLSLTMNAQSSFGKVKGRAIGKGKNTPGQWTMIGPSTANFPDVLTFSGAAYTTSGRVTALAIDPNCAQSKCRVWSGAAGGGVWRTEKATSGNGVSWEFVSGSFGTNAIGALTYAGGVLYAGTGEPNASGDSEAGLGIYKSSDGGDTWTHLASQTTVGAYTGDAFAGRSISAIIVDPTNAAHLYVASARGVRGISSTGGATSNPPSAAPFGLYESNDGGATFTFIWNGAGSIRGVNNVAFDPSYDGSANKTLYAAAFQVGVWRSNDNGATWAQIKTPLNGGLNTDRAEFAVTKLGSGSTRMYVGVGNQSDSGANRARFYRTDDARAAAPAFADMTSPTNIGYCTSQCWYDNVVYSPPGKSNVVYLGGAFSYNTYGRSTNGRGFIRSVDGGATWTDMTWDATNGGTNPNTCCQGNPISPNGMHPDSHAMVEIPGTDSAIFGSDGGLVRSSGAYADISSQCSDRGLTGSSLTTCQELLAAVPTRLFDLNKTLSTLQFQSLSVAADNPKMLQGGTQDNGTFQTTGSAVVWPQEIYGDGGQSGYNVANSALRFNTFTGQGHDANFHNGDPLKWVIISAPIISSPEAALFYPPIVADPSAAAAGSIFEGSQSVWRTQDWGGDQAYLEANCPEFYVSSTTPGCGDFVRIGPSGAEDLTASSADYRGTTRSTGNVARIARTASDTGTMWAATSTGRVFLSKNANDPAASVTYTRLDSLAANSPGRFVTGIAIDPANGNHAWISYNGYDFNTPAQPGHVFSVTYNSVAGTATWTRIDNGAGPLGDLPITDVAFDSATGDIYASSDFGVMRLPSGSTSWVLAGDGLPNVEVSSLTIVPGSRKLFAATHGRSAWALTLP
jgi:hypothetical protein